MLAGSFFVFNIYCFIIMIVMEGVIIYFNNGSVKFNFMNGYLC